MKKVTPAECVSTHYLHLAGEWCQVNKEGAFGNFANKGDGIPQITYWWSPQAELNISQVLSAQYTVQFSVYCATFM